VVFIVISNDWYDIVSVGLTFLFGCVRDSGNGIIMPNIPFC